MRRAGCARWCGCLGRRPLHLDMRRRETTPPFQLTSRATCSPHGSSSSSARTGFDYVHSLVGDHSRLAYSEILPDEKGSTCSGFLARAIDDWDDRSCNRLQPPIRSGPPGWRRTCGISPLRRRCGPSASRPLALGDEHSAAIVQAFRWDTRTSEWMWASDKPHPPGDSLHIKPTRPLPTSWPGAPRAPRSRACRQHRGAGWRCRRRLSARP